MCAPVLAALPVIASVATTGLGIYGAYAGYQSAKDEVNYNYQIQQQQSQFQFMDEQRRMDYQFQEAVRRTEYDYAEQNRQMDYQFQDALRQSDLMYQNQMAARDFEYQQSNMQYQSQLAEQQRRFEYEQAVNQQNYEFQQAQTDLNRGYEQMREQQQQSIIELNSELAGAAYANDLRQIDLMFMQEEEAAAQQKTKGSREAAQARAEIRASGRVGNTVDNLIADYNRQQAQYDFATNRNLAFTGMASQEKKRGAQAQYAARKVSEVPYIKQPYADPIRGLALQPGPGVAPSYGPMPIREGVVRGQVTKGQVTRGEVVQSPVYKSYVSSTPYLVKGLTSAFGGIADVATEIEIYKAKKKNNFGR